MFALWQKTPRLKLMRLDFNETNILVQTIAELEKSSKTTITKMKIIETLYALGVHTDKKHVILKVSIKSLISKLERLSDDEIICLLADHKNNKIIASVCYELPRGTAVMRDKQ